MHALLLGDKGFQHGMPQSGKLGRSFQQQRQVRERPSVGLPQDSCQFARDTWIGVVSFNKGVVFLRSGRQGGCCHQSLQTSLTNPQWGRRGATMSGGCRTEGYRRGVTHVSDLPLVLMLLVMLLLLSVQGTTCPFGDSCDYTVSTHLACLPTHADTLHVCLHMQTPCMSAYTCRHLACLPTHADTLHVCLHMQTPHIAHTRLFAEHS
jgi:hypothetical protein